MILIGGMQKHQSIKTDGICTTLTSSMGTGGGYIPMIVEENKISKLEHLGVGGKKDMFIHKKEFLLHSRLLNTKMRQR